MARSLDFPFVSVPSCLTCVTCSLCMDMDDMRGCTRQVFSALPKEHGIEWAEFTEYIAKLQGRADVLTQVRGGVGGCDINIGLLCLFSLVFGRPVMTQRSPPSTGQRWCRWWQVCGQRGICNGRNQSPYHHPCHPAQTCTYSLPLVAVVAPHPCDLSCSVRVCVWVRRAS